MSRMTEDERKAKARANKNRFYARNRKAIRSMARLARKNNLEHHLARERAYQAAHRDKINARERERRADTRGDAIRAKDRAYYAAKADHYKQYRAANKEAIKKTKRAWVVSNKGAMSAIRFKRIAAEHQALPAWANLIAIKAIYEEAARLTQQTGIKHEVDHIIPIQSALVCGLHCEANMQILTKAQNRQKSNYFTPHISLPPTPSDVELKKTLHQYQSRLPLTDWLEAEP